MKLVAEVEEDEDEDEDGDEDEDEDGDEDEHEEEDGQGQAAMVHKGTTPDAKGPRIPPLTARDVQTAGVFVIPRVGILPPPYPFHQKKWHGYHQCGY